MRSTQRRIWLASVSVVSLGLLAASCQGDQARIDKLESRLSQVSGLTTRLETLESNRTGADGEVEALKASLAEVQASVAEVGKQAGAAGSKDADLQKKIDDLSAKVSSLTSKLSALEQRITLLETRYNDHLRKYHNSPT